MSSLPPYDYDEPASVGEACALLAKYGDRAKVLSGGTDLLVYMKRRVLCPERLISITQLPELGSLTYSNQSVHLGPCLTVSHLAASKVLSKEFRAIPLAAASLGSPLVRNLATVGGNIVSARPAADLIPPLLAYGATLHLRSLCGTRQVSLDHFLLEPGKTDIRPFEVLVGIEIQKPPVLSGSSYIKLGHRRALAISVVNVAASLSIEECSGKITAAGLALGAIAPRVIRAQSAEAVLIGERPRGALFDEAAKLASTVCRPISDIRGSAEYRFKMIEVVSKMALEQAWEQIVKRTP